MFSVLSNFIFLVGEDKIQIRFKLLPFLPVFLQQKNEKIPACLQQRRIIINSVKCSSINILILKILPQTILSMLLTSNCCQKVYVLITNNSYLLIVERLQRPLHECWRHLKVSFISQKLSLILTVCYGDFLSFSSFTNYVRSYYGSEQSRKGGERLLEACGQGLKFQISRTGKILLS